MKKFSNKKLTIIFIENTEDVFQKRKKVLKIINSFVKTGDVCIINYGTLIKKSKVFNASYINYNNLLYSKSAKSNACFYDALLELRNTIRDYNRKVFEESKVTVTDINIVAIGKCIDNCSATSKKEAIDCFGDIQRNQNVLAKYFCLTEEAFFEAATIGFKSIDTVQR